jgi:SIR2-like domain
MDWPQALVVELAARRCAIFLGAGASASCVSAGGASPPNWGALLEHMRTRFQRADDADLLDDLFRKERYLDIAEVLLASAPIAEFSTFIRDILVVPRFQPSAIHKAVLTLDPKLVITTNWDEVYDKHCQLGDARDGYNVCRYYENNIVSALRSPVRVIVKAHGCVTDCSKIVLSRSQYFDARRQYPLFFRVLDSIFLTSTLFFVGYSLNDPDIQLVLENASIAAPSSHTHYAVLPSGTHPALLAAAKAAYNIHVIEYPKSDYAALNRGLDELATAVEDRRANYSA